MTSIAYKLVDRDGYTRRGLTGETLWLPVGTVVSPTGEGDQPCGPGVLHAYISPEVAALAYPYHTDIQDPRILKIKSDSPWCTDGLKRWTPGQCTVLRECELPPLRVTERVAWVICLAPLTATRDWAVRWLSGEDRSAGSAKAAAQAAKAAAWAPDVVVRAANAASQAALAAEWAARTADVAEFAVWAVHVAAKAAAVAAVGAAANEKLSPADRELRLMPTLERARAILAGEYPAEQYDAPYAKQARTDGKLG